MKTTARHSIPGAPTRRRTILRWPSLALAVFLAGTSLRADDASKIKVACVGDSITLGARIQEQSRYPKVLERLLNEGGGKPVEVRNFGVGGQTLLKRGDASYWKNGAFAQAKAYDPNIVVIMLGTNDSKPQNWTFQDEFVGDLKEFVQEFLSLPSKPKVFLLLPPPAYKEAFSIRGDIIKNEVVPKVLEVAKEKSLPAIDVFTAMSNPDYFDDGVHPVAAGAEVLAETVADGLKKNNALQ